MPCNDITDQLKLSLDNNEKIIAYSLTKKVCGGEVGEKSLISDWLANKSTSEIVRTEIEQLLAEHTYRTDKREYLIIKHFLAIKAGLQILSGEKSGGVNDYCTVDSIEYSPEGIDLIAQISVNGISDEIKACGSCTGCGSAK